MELHAMNAGAKAFSLIELLVVIGIMGILLVLAMPAVTSTLEGNNITRAGETVGDQIVLARQIASTRNLAAEVRFIKVPARSAEGYSAVQIWTTDARGASAAANKAVLLPEGVVVSDRANVSPLFSLPLSPAGSMPSGAHVGSAYGGVRMRASGAISPPAAQADRKQLYVTLVNSRFATSAQVPANFITVQINPDTGNTEIYRP